MLYNFGLILFGAFLLSALATLSFNAVSSKLKLSRHDNISLAGGIGIALSLIVACLFAYRPFPKDIIAVFVSSFIVLFFGLVDDGKELSISAKFIVQLIAVTVLVIFGVRVKIVHIGIVLNLIITYIWVIGITNAFNHLDVMDGVAGVSAAIVSLAFFLVAALNNDIKIMVLSLALAGSISGFLIYNLPPARSYMGNSGSHFLGFILSAVALVIHYAPMERKIALVSPVLILGFPIFDTIFLMLMRLSQKKSIFKKSDDHLPLRFLKSGYSKRKSLLCIMLLCLFFSASGVIVSKTSNLYGAVIFLIIILSGLGVIKKMGAVSKNG